MKPVWFGEKIDMIENNKIQNSVWDVLDSINCSFEVDDAAERADIEYFRILREGEAENNLNKIYEFIDVAERSSQPMGDTYLPAVLEEAYKTDAVRLFQFIEGKNDLVDYWVFLSMINDKEILFSFAEMQSQNALLHYECARQILRRFSYNEEYEVPCQNAIVKFACKDIELWTFWIKKYEHNSKWAKITWNVLSKLGEKELIAYSDNVSLIASFINEIGRNIQEGFNGVDIAKQNQIISIISNNIYERWEKALNVSKVNGRYQNGILLSNYTNIILSSMNVIFSDNLLWVEQFKRYACLLDADLHKWYSSEKNHFSPFFLNLTNIYYLLVIKENSLNSLDFSEAKHSAELIKFILSRYEFYWKFTESAVTVTRIYDLLTQIG